MPEGKKETSRSAIPTVSTTLAPGGIVELVYDPAQRRTRLAVSSANGATLQESIDIDDGTRLVPWSAKNNLIKHEVVLLPEHADDFGSVATLVAEIDAYLYRYVDLSEHFRKIAAYYVLLSWVYDAFNELPYLRLRGDYGSGKTRALIVIGSLCYKAFIASGASTVSPIFHILDAFRGTLVLDEADFRFSDEKAELSKILNNGNVRGIPVLRTMVTPTKEFNPRAFNVFGPKIVAMRRSFDDAALESRFITEEMGERPLRSDIPINLPARHKEEARALRNKLLTYRMRYRFRVSLDDTLVDASLSPRMNQILVPLLSIVDDDQLRMRIRAGVRHVEDELAAERAASIEAQLLDVVMSLRKGDRSVAVAEITRAFVERFGSDYERPITNRYIGSVLRRRLHLLTYKTDGVYVVAMKDEEKLEALCARYGVEPPTPM
jgi:hypothetical protein